MAVTQLSLARSAFEEGRPFGAIGPYEHLRGTADIGLDPAHPRNAPITDLSLAPRGPDGRVHLTADVLVVRPSDPRRSNGCLILDVVNRGRPIALRMLGADWLLGRGYTLAMCGWQHDLPASAQMLGARLPAASHHHRPITGLVRSVQQPNAPTRTLPLGDGLSSVAHVGYTPVDGTDPTARVVERDHPWGPSRDLPRDRWRFATDGSAIESDAEFTPGKIYEIIYTAVGPPITGAGLAANRDWASFLRYATAEQGNPCAQQIRHVIAFGASQTGRFLRQFVYLGMCEDEHDRTAVDGVLTHIAGARQIETNWRFGQSSYNGADSMGALFPFADATFTDPVTDITDGLLRCSTSRGWAPKLMHVNSSAEYWGPQNAALIHVNPDGSRDADIPESVRIYHLAGCDHFANRLPLTDRLAPMGDVRTPYYLNSIDYTPLLQAVFSHLADWVTAGTPPPPSRYPRLSDATLVPCDAVAAVFARLPGPGVPPHRNPLKRLDFGPHVTSGVATRMPADAGAAYPELAPAVDADGNEISGIRHPDVSVPLATYTGWHPRPRAIGGPDMPLPALGATLPFARTPAQRATAGDPRRSIAERYPSRAAYLASIRAAADTLVADGYLLSESVEALLAASAERYRAFTDEDVYRLT